MREGAALHWSRLEAGLNICSFKHELARTVSSKYPRPCLLKRSPSPPPQRVRAPIRPRLTIPRYTLHSNAMRS